MDVLHLYAGNLFGGIERLLVTLAEQQGACPSMRHHFGLCFEGKLSRQLRDAGADVHLLGNVRLSRPWTAWRARRHLRALVRSTLPTVDVIVTHSSWPHVVFAPAANRLKPLVFWSHDAYEHPTRLDRLASRTPPTHVIANSRFTASTLPNLFPGTPVSVLYYPVTAPPPVDSSAIPRKIRAAFGCAEATVVIVCMARLDRWKGQTLLIDALGKLEETNWEAWIGGGVQRPEEQVYLDELKRQAGDRGIGARVKFIGHRGDVADVLAAADIHCQSNTAPEPFGIAFLEALYAGLPVVTTRLGAPIDTIDESCGRLVPPADPAALAAALSELIENESLRRKLGGAGPRHAETLCNPKQQMPALERAFQNVIIAAGTRP